MPLIAQFGEQSIDLITIKTVVDFRGLNRYSQEERKIAAKKMVKELSDQSIMQVIIRLTPLCFEAKGSKFIREGASDFLANVILAYVKKHDGKRLAKAFNKNNILSLADFKFSDQAVKVFNTLQTFANLYSHEKKDPLYSQRLPGNVANKIWQPIIFKRQSVGKPAKDSVLAAALQTMAADEPLVTAIFNKNTTVRPFTLAGLQATKAPDPIYDRADTLDEASESVVSPNSPSQAPKSISASQSADHDEAPCLPPKQFGQAYYQQLIKLSPVVTPNQAPDPINESLVSQQSAIKDKPIAPPTSAKTAVFFPTVGAQQNHPEETTYLTAQEMQ